jgi:hypothetical protein
VVEKVPTILGFAEGVPKKLKKITIDSPNGEFSIGKINNHLIK